MARDASAWASGEEIWSYDKAGLNNEILIEDIAIEAGANEEMLKYIKLQLENQNNFL